jgi:hypothetical protein
MELGEVAKLMLFIFTLAAAVAAAGVILGVRSLYTDIKRIAEESDAPYKIEPAEQLAVSKPRKKTGRPLGSKGGYTKRSSYWDEQRKRSAAKKARQEKMRAARAKVRESIGH